MLVTSLTTAAAFFASMLSSITAVRCFGIFAGTTVMVNYVIMMTWLPAVVAASERIHWCCCPPGPCNRFCGFFSRGRESFERFEKLIVRLVMCVPWVWIALFGSLGVLSSVVVFYWPGLQLPNTSHFKLFVSSNPFEVYDSVYKSRFHFEKNLTVRERKRGI